MAAHALRAARSARRPAGWLNNPERIMVQTPRDALKGQGYSSGCRTSPGIPPDSPRVAYGA